MVYYRENDIKSWIKVLFKKNTNFKSTKNDNLIYHNNILTDPKKEQFIAFKWLSIFDSIIRC